MSRSSLTSGKNGSKENTIIVGGKYRTLQKIGSGSFGDVYRGVTIANPDKGVAIKMERMDSPRLFLEREAEVYKGVREPYCGIPQFKWYGQDMERGLNILVTELCGPSLEHLLKFCGGKFSVKTVLILAGHMLERVACLHRMGYVHRDLKADNFLMGVGRQCNEVYIIDFGMAKQYRDPQTMEHLPLEGARRLVGTMPYISLNAHRQLEQTRRDDLEALAYVLIYLLKGSLPWQDISEENKKEKANKVKESKMSVSIEELCKGIPSGFGKFLKYCRRLEYDEEPNYDALREKFRKMFQKLGFVDDGKYDWNLKNTDRFGSNTTPPEKKGSNKNVKSTSKEAKSKPVKAGLKKLKSEVSTDVKGSWKKSVGNNQLAFKAKAEEKKTSKIETKTTEEYGVCKGETKRKLCQKTVAEEGSDVNCDQELEDSRLKKAKFCEYSDDNKDVPTLSTSMPKSSISVVPASFSRNFASSMDPSFDSQVEIHPGVFLKVADVSSSTRIGYIIIQPKTTSSIDLLPDRV